MISFSGMRNFEECLLCVLFPAGLRIIFCIFLFRRIFVVFVIRIILVIWCSRGLCSSTHRHIMLSLHRSFARNSLDPILFLVCHQGYVVVILTIILLTVRGHRIRHLHVRSWTFLDLTFLVSIFKADFLPLTLLAFALMDGKALLHKPRTPLVSQLIDAFRCC